LIFELHRHHIHAIVVDIEGTTTPIDFVYEVLFPFARTHLRDYLDQAEVEHLREPIRRLRAEWSADVEQGNGPPQWSPPNDAQGLRPEAQEANAYVEWLMDRDRKSPGLKLLQGQIWERGYAAGLLHGEVFPDVPPALQRWRDSGITIAIYSSGSQLAQRLLFGSTRQGDLTTLISRFFDTEVGAKVAAESYVRIGRELACPVEHVLFVSDVSDELNAAREAGCQTLLCVRPGNRSQPEDTYTTIRSFDEIV
jgi:enolase-phosphatase E1